MTARYPGCLVSACDIRERAYTRQTAAKAVPTAQDAGLPPINLTRPRTRSACCPAAVMGAVPDSHDFSMGRGAAYLRINELHIVSVTHPTWMDHDELQGILRTWQTARPNHPNTHSPSHRLLTKHRLLMKLTCRLRTTLSTVCQPRRTYGLPGLQERLLGVVGAAPPAYLLS